MKIIFMLPSGVIEWPVPEELRPGFNFMAFSGNIRLQGYFQSPDLHLRYDQLVGLSWVASDEAPRIVTKPGGFNKDLN